MFWTVEGSDTPPTSGSIEVTGLGPDGVPVPGERWSVPSFCRTTIDEPKVDFMLA